MKKNSEKLVEETQKLREKNKMLHLQLQQQMKKAQDTLEQIKTGQIDALVIPDKNGLKIYTEKTTDKTYRILIEKMHEGAVTINKDGIILFSNSSFAGMVNQPLQKVIGSRFHNFIENASIKHFQALEKKGLDGYASEELSLVANVRKVIPVLLSITGLKIDDEIILSVIVADISMRKKNEREIRYLASIVESSDDAIITKSLEGIIKSWNKGGEKLFGYTAKEAIGKNISLIIPKEYFNEEKEIIRRIRNNETVHYETFRKHKTGKQFYVSITVSPLKDEAGNIVGAAKIARDITVRKKNEVDLIQTNKKLIDQIEENDKQAAELKIINLELQKKNNEIALSKYNKTFLTEFSEKFSSYKTHVEFFNSVVQYISDLTHIDYVFIGKLEKTESDKFVIQTIALNAFGKLVDNITYALPDGPCEQVIRSKLYSYPQKCRITFPKNKTLVQFNVEGYIGYPLYDTTGNAIGLIAVMHQKAIEEPETVSSVLKIVAKRTETEIERIKNEELLEQNNLKLIEKNKELEKANKELGFQILEKEKKETELNTANKELTTFNYVSSHDLQEPLRKIKNFVSVLLVEEEKKLSDEGKSYLQRMYQVADGMQTLIEDLLAYSRAKNAESKFEKINLTIIVDEVKKEFEEVIQKKKATIEIGALCETNIIRFQFHQLIQNLISNSLKFSKAKVAPRIKISSEIVHGNKLNNEKLPRDNDYCHIIYSDNGIGFDSQYNERIFEVFQRLHSKEEYEGTGIGLAIVKRIVENHKGIITATGNLNKGAKFDIYIPVK